MTEHFDVMIVGAGISGIGAAVHLTERCPRRSYVILEGRPRIGGTWDLFRYPGIRSDSDMYTLGYEFKPWTGDKAIADGPDILAYVEETADEYGVRKNIRFSHLVERAEWSSKDAKWTVYATVDGETTKLTCNFLFMCSGYYSYKSGYTPEFEARDDFEGQIIHPQEWPEDLDYAGKRVVVIGSGATAMTLIPAMTDKAGHVVMLQRSPTYVVSRPARDVVARALRRVLPERLAYEAVRRKNVALGTWFFNLTRTKPQKVRRKLISMVRKELGPDFDVDKHFQPYYNPWEQRLCLVPDSDFFKALRAKKASIVTDHIDRFTKKGILLKSGEELEADIIVTATGLRVVTLGEASFSMDGEELDFSERFAYRGLAFEGVPNLATTFGYVNASWTLRVDLVCRHICRMLNHMEATGTRVCIPTLRESDQDMQVTEVLPGFSSGYIQRARPLMPKQGDRVPWTTVHDYKTERQIFRDARVDDGTLVFSH